MINIVINMAEKNRKHAKSPISIVTSSGKVGDEKNKSPGRERSVGKILR